MVVLIVLVFGASLLSGRGYGGWGYGGWGMMGPWMMGGMMFMWLFPIGFIVLTVFGIAWPCGQSAAGPIPPFPLILVPPAGAAYKPTGAIAHTVVCR